MGTVVPAPPEKGTLGAAKPKEPFLACFFALFSAMASELLRPALTHLLNNAFPKVTFKPETLCKPGTLWQKLDNPTLKGVQTPLFALARYDDHIYIEYDQKRFVSMMCMRFIAHIDERRQNFNGETSTIPVR